MMPTRLKKKRAIIYQDELLDDVPGIPVFSSESYEAFRLRIKRRDTGDDFGESNFLIRDKSNNLRYVLLYCIREQPEIINSMSFWVNNTVPIPAGYNAYAGDLLDEEVAILYVMDFVERFLKDKNEFPN